MMNQAGTMISVRRTTAIIALIVLMVLFALNIVLVIQYRNLAKSIANLKNSKVSEPQIGKRMSPLTGFNQAGEQITFDWSHDNRKTVLLIFSPLCGYCKKNMGNWRALLDGIDKTKFRPVLVSSISEGVEDYLTKYQINDVPVIKQPHPKLKVEYEMRLTPQTLVLDSDGKVEKVWLGEIQPEQKNEVNDFFKVQLPL